MENHAYLPTTPAEMKKRGWERADIILVTGDSYIDSPFMGIAVIGRVLERAGYRVAVIAQPDTDSEKDIGRLGEPKLFWGVSAGSVDSMVANYTATGKRRKQDDYTPGGINDRRPDRAVIVYANLIRRFFKDTAPIVLGGIEASLRRVSHYDFWSNRVRRSILFDAKADYLVYGMGERAVLELAACLKASGDHENIRGLSYIAKERREDYTELPAHEAVAGNPSLFRELFATFYHNNDPAHARGLCQKHGDRYLVQNPPADYLTEKELDDLSELNFQRDLHPWYGREGEVRALDTIRFSIATHRGCYGECNFCAIAVHQGRTVRWRSENSIVREAESFITHKEFKGNILDLGGPTANMYGFECDKKLKRGSCRNRRCLFPEACPHLKPDHGPLRRLLGRVRGIKGVKRVFVASGIRHDLLLADKTQGLPYLGDLVSRHISGQMKIAPEHVDEGVLKCMGKPGGERLMKFKNTFDRLTRAAGKKQYLTYYFMAAHPGCSDGEMKTLKKFATSNLGLNPEQVQIFTPTPGTWSTLMYHTGTDLFDGNRLFVERDRNRKEAQKRILTRKGAYAGKVAGRSPAAPGKGRVKKTTGKRSFRPRCAKKK